MNKALIIVDVWDNHWDYDTFKNTDKLAKEINSFASVFRENGDCVIHAPSMVRRQYKSCDIPIKVNFDMIEPYKLESKLKDYEESLVNYRFQKVLQQLENPFSIRFTKRSSCTRVSYM